MIKFGVRPGNGARSLPKEQEVTELSYGFKLFSDLVFGSLR